MSDSVIPWTVACQAPLSIEFSRQKYWSGYPVSSPGDLPNPVIELGSPALQEDSLPYEPPGKSPGKEHSSYKVLIEFIFSSNLVILFFLLNYIEIKLVNFSLTWKVNLIMALFFLRLFFSFFPFSFSGLIKLVCLNYCVLKYFIRILES